MEENELEKKEFYEKFAGWIKRRNKMFNWCVCIVVAGFVLYILLGDYLKVGVVFIAVCGICCWVYYSKIIKGNKEFVNFNKKLFDVEQWFSNLKDYKTKLEIFEKYSK